MRKPLLVLSALLGASLLVASLAVADVKLAAVISDGMVLQRDIHVPIWGTDEPGREVTVTFRDQRVSVIADAEGRWMVRLEALEAGGPFAMTVTGSSTVTLHDAVVGDVWVCSGQSNMAMSVQRASNAEQEIAEADYPMIRLFKVSNVVADEPRTDTEGAWETCRPETVAGFSAAGYFFGRDLHKELQVPIGLIGTYWGGTPAEAWTSKATLQRNLAFNVILKRWDQVLADYPKAMEQHQQRVAQWEEAVTKARAEGTPVPRRPRAPRGPGHHSTPSGLFNGMIAPLIPYAIRGAIWYQGEGNAGRAYEYRKLFPAMIRDWRRSWGQGVFPFLFVQLPNYGAVAPEPSESDWAELREAQLMTLSLPKTGMAIAMGLGEADDIHPKNKLDVGRRLAGVALGTVYGHDVVYSGPMYKSSTVEGHKVRITFKHLGGGLVAKGGARLKGFAIAGPDRKFVWAIARIDGDTVVVSSPPVRKPVAVRYAWADNPVCNLYNAAGLPASPFRTDDWPGITQGRP